MEYMCSVTHELPIHGCAVHTLAVHDRPLKHVAELSLVTKEVWSDKVDHAPVFQKVILEWVARQYHATSDKDGSQIL